MKHFNILKRVCAFTLAYGLSCASSWGQLVTTFDYTGDMQTYVVPDGITRISIEAFGAEGGTSNNDAGSCIIGGWGGTASGELEVTPGETLYIYVGGEGNAGNVGGWNGGGESCENASTCAKGGGASDVRRGGTELDDRLIVAGGGGGAEWSGCSGSAGDGGGLDGIGGAHPSFGGRNGGGGSQIAGGVAGVGGYNGMPGEFGIGGAAGAHPAGHSGSGGGGWYGGGGSAEDGHAGGGSSYIDGVELGETTSGVREGHGQIIITELCSPLTVTVSDDEICLGETITLEASGDGEISWDGDLINGEPYEPAEAGTVTFTATSDDDGECPYPVEITILELPEVTASVDEEEICLGEEIVLTGGGTDEYVWDPEEVEDGMAYEPTDAGTITYTVIGTDEETGCENEATVEVVVNALPEVVATASDESICIGDELTLTGEGAVSYVWDPEAEDGVAFTPEDAGTITYTVEGTDDNGCSAEATVEVEVNDLPEVTASADAEEVCFGDEVTLTGGGAETYEWDPDGVVDGSPYTTSVEGVNTFTVTGTDANGCVNTASVDVNVLDEIVVTFTTTDEIGGGDGAIDVSVSGGAPDYTYDWDTDETGDFDDEEDLTDLTGGTYTLVVMDDNGCTTTVEIEVNSQVGIKDLALEQIKVYPNPTTGNVMISGVGNFTYSLTAINGKVLLTDTIVDTETIDLSEFANGVYYITLRMNDSVRTVKVVKQ